ncbi:MAG: IS110 family transposase [PVC group bacterium]|nr:IS110 family transposase [PVC group bacterium]
MSKQISQIEKDKKNVAVCIERPNGLLVEYLWDLGYSIYPVNPMAAERVRDRYKVTKVKDDKLDAWALANFVRTDLEMLRLLKPSSEQIRRLKILVRDRKYGIYKHKNFESVNI